jgi:uncharacterized protein YbaP (TraB family)
MKKSSLKVILTGIILLILFPGSVTQCSEDNRDGTLKNSVIWRISGPNLPAPSFLFGTVHVIDPEGFSMHATVIEQLKRSETLVFESNIAEPGYQQQALARAMMENDSLDGILSQEHYEALTNFFRDEFNLPVEALKHMNPFYLASLIGTLNKKEQATSHEAELLRIARNEGKEIAGISTLERESEILKGINLEEQVEYLFDEIESYQNGRSEELEQTIRQAYKEADIEQIYTVLTKALEKYPSVFEQLFIARNESWLPSMIDLMKERSCFFAVGVGHLAGESGLIRLLRSQGYRVVPVNLDFWFHS